MAEAIEDGNLRGRDSRVERFQGPDDPDEEFSFGLERILDGIGALVAAR